MRGNYSRKEITYKGGYYLRKNGKYPPSLLIEIGLNISENIGKALTTGMHQKWTDSVLNENKIVYVLIIIDLIAVILVHIRIEIYKREEILAGLNWSEYTINTRRKVFGVIFISTLLIFSRYISPTQVMVLFPMHKL